METNRKQQLEEEQTEKTTNQENSDMEVNFQLSTSASRKKKTSESEHGKRPQTRAPQKRDRRERDPKERRKPKNNRNLAKRETPCNSTKDTTDKCATNSTYGKAELG